MTSDNELSSRFTDIVSDIATLMSLRHSDINVGHCRYVMSLRFGWPTLSCQRTLPTPIPGPSLNDSTQKRGEVTLFCIFPLFYHEISFLKGGYANKTSPEQPYVTPLRIYGGDSLLKLSLKWGQQRTSCRGTLCRALVELLLNLLAKSQSCFHAAPVGAGTFSTGWYSFYLPPPCTYTKPMCVLMATAS